MNAFSKIGAAAAVVLLATIGLMAGGVLPTPSFLGGSRGEPVAVSFRPITPEVGIAEVPAAGGAVAPSERRPVAAPSIAASEESEAGSSDLAVIEASIVDVNGRPLGGAHLREVREEGPGAQADSDRDGRVRLELELALDRPERRVKVEASLVGYASAAEEVRVEAGRSAQLGTIVLRPGGMISGRVLDEDGRGIEGALVTHAEGSASGAQLSSQRFVPSDAAARRLSVPRALTDATGRFLLAGLEEEYYRLWVDADGWIPTFTQPVEVREGQEAYGVEITMTRVRDKDHVVGVVLDPSGAPVPFAELGLGHSSKKGGLTIRGMTQEAEADGTFDILLYDDARLSITARDPEGLYGPASAEDVRTGEGQLVLRLQDLARARLLVMDSDGEPLERYAYALLSPDEELLHHESETAERAGGKTEFMRPDADFLIRVKASMHAVELAGPFRPDALTDPIELRLRPIAGLSGRVLAAGEPLAGVRLELNERSGVSETTLLNGFLCKLDPIGTDTTTSDQEGRFQLSAFTRGEYYVSAEKSGFAPAEIGPLLLGPDLSAAPVEIHMGRGGAIEGRVIAESGAGVAGTIVAVTRGDANPQTQRVGEDGAFRFTGLTPGPWVVEKRDLEYFRDRREVTTRQGLGTSFLDEVEWSCEVYEGETTFHDLRLVDEEAFRLVGSMRVEGRLAHAWVARLLPADASLMDFDAPGTPLDPEGGFELGVPEPGDYQLLLKSTLEEQEEQFFLDQVRLDGPETAWNLELATGALVIEGIEPLPDGQDWPTLCYIWEGPGDLGYLSALFPDEDGVCRLKAVPVGKGELVRPNPKIMEPREWPVALEVTIREGETTRVEAP